MQTKKRTEQDMGSISVIKRDTRQKKGKQSKNKTKQTMMIRSYYYVKSKNDRHHYFYQKSPKLLAS